jgi:hypothetical protein
MAPKFWSCAVSECLAQLMLPQSYANSSANACTGYELSQGERLFCFFPYKSDGNGVFDEFTCTSSLPFPSGMRHQVPWPRQQLLP